MATNYVRHMLAYESGRDRRTILKLAVGTLHTCCCETHPPKSPPLRSGCGAFPMQFEYVRTNPRLPSRFPRRSNYAGQNLCLPCTHASFRHPGSSTKAFSELD